MASASWLVVNFLFQGICERSAFEVVEARDTEEPKLLVVAKLLVDDVRGMADLNGERRLSMVPANNGGADGSRDLRGGKGPKVAPEGWGVMVARMRDGERGGPIDASRICECDRDWPRVTNSCPAEARENESRAPKAGASTDIWRSSAAAERDGARAPLAAGRASDCERATKLLDGVSTLRARPAGNRVAGGSPIGGAGGGE